MKVNRLNNNLKTIKEKLKSSAEQLIQDLNQSHYLKMNTIDIPIPDSLMVFLSYYQYALQQNILIEYPQLNQVTPQVRLIVNVMHEMHFDISSLYLQNNQYLISHKEQLQDLLQRIIAYSQGRFYLDELMNNQRRYLDNVRSMHTYVDELFERYSKLLVIRIDLSYKANIDINYDEFKGHHARFLKLFESHSRFEHLKGYIWKIEYGLQKGYHLHFLLLFNGHEVRMDEVIAIEIGKLWEEITDDRGIYFNCNDPHQKSRYKYCGLGTIKHDDTCGRNGLIRIVNYLIKTDDFKDLTRIGNNRIIGKGLLPAKTNLTGRPRLLK